MFTGRAFSGTRCGPLRQSTSACRRSASEMMTWVYSASAALRQLGLQQLGGAAQAADSSLHARIAQQFAVRLDLDQAMTAIGQHALLDLARLDQHGPALARQ